MAEKVTEDGSNALIKALEEVISKLAVQSFEKKK